MATLLVINHETLADRNEALQKQGFLVLFQQKQKRWGLKGNIIIKFIFKRLTSWR